MHQPSFTRHRFLPYLLILPQLLITVLFFLWPAILAIVQAFVQGDAFGIHSRFVWFDNFIDILSSLDYLQSLWVTLIFSTGTAILAMIMGLVFALMVNKITYGKNTYKVLLILPYAIAPAVVAMLWRFIFDPSVGVMHGVFAIFGIEWNYILKSDQAMWMVITAAAWQQFSYNFLFFLAGLQAIPRSLLEAAEIDGANFLRRLRDIILPLLSPITFFLLVVNILYSLFDTFGIINILTQGGPANSTNILVYKVYNDGINGLDWGASSAQSVLLMIIVIILSILQFRFIDKKVHYR